MKWSKYNALIDNGDSKYLLYNCSTDNLMIFVEDIKNIISQNVNTPEQIERVHPSLFQNLLDNQYIIDESVDEVENLIKEKEKELSSGETFKIILNPTMDCNLRCWYCYETHEPKSSMSKVQMDKVRLLIKNKVQEDRLMHLAISFFGGEPLLKFRSTILPLISYSKDLCEKTNKKLSIGFTTNAVLLTSQIVDYLSMLEIEVNLQVPFDGDKIEHNKIKKFSNGKGSFDIVFNNVKYAIEKGLKVNIRCNYNSENLASFKMLVSDFISSLKNYRDNFKFSFQPIWQSDNDLNHTRSILLELKQILESNNCLSDGIYQSAINSICYADSPDSVVINYNGDVYKCSAQDFIPELREGVLDLDGNITYNERYSDRMHSRFYHEACYDCRILPFCHICSQKKITQFLQSTCPIKMTEQGKMAVIRDRIQFVSNNIIKTD